MKVMTENSGAVRIGFLNYNFSEVFETRKTLTHRQKGTKPKLKRSDEKFYFN